MQLPPFAALSFLAQATAPEAAQSASAAAASLSSGEMIKLGGLLVASQVVIIISYWIASQLFARERGRFINALKTWALYLVALIAMAVAAGVLFPLIAMNFPRVFLVAIGVAVLLAVAVTFQVPMRVYEIGFGSALGFLIVSFVLSSAAHLAIDRATGVSSNILTAGKVHVPVDQQARIWSAVEKVVGKKPRMSPDEAIAADPARPIAERHAALQRVHRELQAKHAALKEGDQPALETYNQALARYEKLVAQVQAAQQ